MANVTMPNGDVVAFPDDMPKTEIRALIEKKFPDAARQALHDTGKKPYQTAMEGLGTLVGNLPASIAESKTNLSQMAAEAVTDFISPRKQVGNTPPLQVTPGAPVEGLLNQPAGVTYDVEGTGFGEGLPDGTISPVSLGPLLPDGVKQAVAQNAARQSLAAQLRGMESRGQQKPFDMQPGLGSDVIQGVAAGVEMIAPAAASMVVRNPAPLVAYFTARSAGTGYGEAKAAGAPNDRARAAAGLYAAAEAVTEAVAGRVFLEGGKTLVRSILKGGAVEGLTEAATEALQALVDAGVIGEDVTLDEALGRIKTAAVAGAVAGAPIAALTHGIRAGQTEATPQMVVNEPVKPVDPDTPIEERVALPGPQTLLALPSPEAFAPPPATRRQGPAPAVAEKVIDDADYAARVALGRTKQAETAELLQTARETITPLGAFDVAEIGDDAAGRVRQHRIRMGRPVEAPVTIEDLARAKVPQRRIDAIIAQRRPITSEGILRPVDVRNAAAERNITYDDSNFGELAFRTTGQRNLDRMSQAQLNALKTTLEAMPVNAEHITVPVAEQSRFTDDQYGKALDALRTQGRYTAKAIKDATGINDDKDVRAIRDAMVRRGQLVERGKGDYRLYDVLGEERQSTPDDLPPGAFKEHVVRRIPVGKVRVRVDGKSVGTYGSGTEARGKVSDLRAAKGPKAQIVIEPAEEVAWGVMENRYDQEGNLLGQVVVDTHRDETAAAKAATELNAPADTGARYTATPVPGAAPAAQPAPKRVIEPAALAGRMPEILKRLNQQAKDRKLPLLGVRVQVKSRIKTMEGDDVEGLYWRKLMQLTAQNLDASMSADEIVERLGQVMDHETIHALREAGVLGPETAGWKSIMRYARRAKRPGTNETYFEWARRSYTGIPGYTDPSAIEEEAIAEAFRHWASNKRSVVGQPATVFRQLVEWFKRLISAMPEDVFRAIETGAMVEEALTPPGSNQPRARATKAMQEAAAEVTEAVEAKNENAARVRSREYLRARAQAREDRFGRSGPKTVLGTNAGRGYNEADVDTAFPRAVAEKYRKDNGVQTGALHTLLPEDTTYLMRVADAQQRGSNSPGADDVAKAYRALIDETKAMWRALGDVVVEAWTGDGAPYASAAEMLADVAGGRLRMRLSDDLFGPGADNPGHPLNAASGVKTVDGRDLTNNDLFRVVHDIYGYGQSGFRDSPRGAYNAYHEHARLVSPEARRALATETLAQSAWANYGQHLRRRDGTVPRETDVDYLKPSLKEFAEQKAFLLPEDVVTADPGWALADAAAGTVEDVPRFSVGESFDAMSDDDLLTALTTGSADTDSRAFKAWFKQSKVTDDEGQPQVVYHNTHNDIEAFDVDASAKRFGKSFNNIGIWFSNRKDAKGGAGMYGPKQYPVYLSMQKPFVIHGHETRDMALGAGGDTAFRKFWKLYDKLTDEASSPAVGKSGFPVRAEQRLARRDPKPMRKWLKENGYDGLILRNTFGDTPSTEERGQDMFVVLEPNQIKSTENIGTFDPDDSRIRYSRFDDNLPGGRLYGNPNRSPGGALSAPGTPSPAFTSDRPGNQFFGGELAERQLEMARTGERGATMVYLTPDEYLALANAPENPEQVVYDDALNAGYKASTLPSLVIAGYAGNVRAVDSDGAATVRALANRGTAVPVVLYPKSGESLGLVTALEGPDGARVPWPHDGRAENFPEVRGPRYSVGSPEFRRWFGDSKARNEDGSPLVVFHGTQSDFNAFAPVRQGTTTFMGIPVEVTRHGIFFTADKKFAQSFADSGQGQDRPQDAHVIPAFLSVQNPLNLLNGMATWRDQQKLIEAGIDKGWVEDHLGDPRTTWEAFEGDNAAWFVERLRAAGYDGVVMHEEDPAEVDGGSNREVWVAFEPTQIKSAVNNNGQYDAANPDIRYSINAPVGTRVPTTPPGPMYNIVQQRTEGAVGNFLKNIGRSRAKLFGRGPSVFDLRRTLQDKNLSIKELIEQVGEAGGQIDDLNDTYMLEQLYHGKVFEEIKEREDRLQVPLLEALKDAYDSPEKVTPTDFEDYLYARHAPERNAFLRTRGAPSPNPSGMSDAEAGATLDKFALTGKLPTLERLAALADNIAKDTTRTRVEGGLISPEAAAASPYQYYVPLRGLAEEELDPGEDTPQTRARSGKGFSVGGREDRAVTGRSKKAGDLLGHLFLQNTEAVIRAQKNEVALSFMRLMQDNPDAGIGQILKTAPTRRVVGANGMIMEAGDPTYRQQPDIVTAKWKGKEIIARVADPDVARAIKSDYVTSSNWLVNALGRMNRYLAMVNTSLNPEFLISNLARDLQTAGILSQQYDIKGLTGNVIKNAPAAMAGIREVLRKGTANSDWAQTFVEMQAAGGTTEFLGIHDLESKIKQIRNSVTRTGLAPTFRQAAEYGKNVLGFINDYNKIAENAFRLSAYKAARDAGVSIPKAAYLAKNLTINFNKGGEQKSLANSLYLFYNASTQGTFVLLNGLKNKRVQRIVGGVVVAGILQDIINRALSGDDDDNGVTDYDDIPDYVLQTNFVMMDPLGIVPRTKTGGQGYFAFPMPYGFNAFWNLGRNMSAGMSGSPVHNPGKSAMNGLSGFLDAFNPLGGVQSVWNFIAPTFADPIVDIITNKDFAGNDIVPERPSFGLPVPDSQKYWSNTNEVPKYIAEQLNSLTGGNEVRKGAVDWSPEVLQYVFDYATGAAGKFATRTAKFGAETVPSMLQGDFENIEVGDIPFARRVVGSVNNRANTERYYAVAEEVATVAEELKMFSESGRPEETRRVFQENPAEVQMIGAFEKANKALSAMRKQIRDLRETEAIPAPRKKEMINQIKAEQDRLMAMLNKAYFERKRVLALN